MKIALLTHSVNPRGGVVHTLELGEALLRLGHEVIVMALGTPGQEFFRPTTCQVEMVPIGEQKDASTYEMVKRRIEAYIEHLKIYLKYSKIDIFHAHDGIGANALIALKEMGLIQKWVRTVHHLDVFENSQVQKWQTLSVVKADAVLSVSEFWQNKINEDFKLNAHLVNNGVNSTFFSTINLDIQARLKAQFKVSSQGPVILCLGGIEERKNTIGVLKAFYRLRLIHPKAQLIIAGGASILDHSKYVRSFHETAKELGFKPEASDELIFTGPIPNAWMPSLMHIADLLVMASTNEGFGLVTLEALCAGTPIVVSKIKPFTEYLCDEDCTWADPFNTVSLELAMSQALQNYDPKKIKKSAKKLSQIYNWDTSADKHQSIYQSLLQTQEFTCQ